MNVERLVAHLRQAEGFRAKLYLDTEGVPTIGYGHSLPYATPEDVAELEWTREQAENALAADIRTAMLEANHFPWWKSLDPVRQQAVVELVYYMGRPRLMGFKRMIDALGRQRWRTTGYELVKSKWATQVGPTRAGRVRRMIETGRDDCLPRV